MLKVREKRKQKHIIIPGCLQHGAITFNKHNISFKAKKRYILFNIVPSNDAPETKYTRNQKHWKQNVGHIISSL